MPSGAAGARRRQTLLLPLLVCASAGLKLEYLESLAQLEADGGPAPDGRLLAHWRYDAARFVIGHMVNARSASGISFESRAPASVTESARAHWELTAEHANGSQLAVTTSNTANTLRLLPKLPAVLTPFASQTQRYLDNTWMNGTFVTSMMPPFTDQAEIYVRVMQYYGWQNIFIFSDADQLSDEAAAARRAMLRVLGQFFERLSRYDQATGTGEIKITGIYQVMPKTTDAVTQGSISTALAKLAASETNVVGMLFQESTVMTQFLPLATALRASNMHLGYAYLGSLAMEMFSYNDSQCSAIQGYLNPTLQMSRDFVRRLNDMIKAPIQNSTMAAQYDAAGFTRHTTQIKSYLALGFAADMVSVYAKALESLMQGANTSSWSRAELTMALRAVTLAADGDDTLTGDVAFNPTSGLRKQQWGLYSIGCNSSKMAIQNTSKEKTWIGVWDETSGLSMNGAARAVEFPGSNTKGQLPMDRSLMRLGLAYSSYSQACTYDFALRMINQELQRNPISSVTTPIRFAGVQLPLPKRSNTTTPKCELADSAQCPIEGSTTITYQMELLNNLVNKALSKKPNGAIGFLGTGFSDLNLRIRTFQGSSQLGFPALQVDNVAIDPTLINNKHNKFYMTAGSTQLDGVFAVCSLLKSFGWERAGAVFFTNGLGKSFKRAWYDQIEEAGISANGLLELPVAPSGRLDIKRMEESGFAEGVMRAYQLTGVSVTVAFFAGWAANTDDMAWVGRKLHNSGMMDAGRALIFPPGFTKVLKDKLCSLQMAQDGLCLDTTFQASTGVWASGPLSHFRQSGLDAFMGSLFLEDWPPDAEFLRSVRGQCSTTADSLGLTNYELYQWNDWEVESLPRAFNSVWTYYEAVRAVIEQSDSSAGKIIYDSSAFRGTLQDVRFVSNVTHLYQNYPRHCDFHPSLGTLKMPTSNNLAYEFKIRNLRLANSTTVEFADVGGLSTLLEIGDVRWTVNQDWGKLSASDTGCQREGRRTTSTKTSDRPTLYSYRDGGHNVRPARRGAPSIVWPGSVTTIPIDFTACRDGWYFSRDRGLCSPCPRSFYSGGTDLECIKCPPYTMTATSAATSISMCICQVGTYRPYEGSVGCELCKENYYCNGTPLNTTEEGVSLDWWVEPPRAEQGYWTACNYPPDDCAIYECPVKDQCVIDSQCDGKSHGTLCAECNDDYLSSNYGMACTECPGSGSFIVLFIICIAIGITYGTYLVMSTTNEGVFERCAPRLSIAIVTIGFFQTFQVLQAASVIRVDWVHPIDWLPNLPTLLGLILSGSGHLTLMRSFVQCYTDSYTSLSVIIVTTMSTGVIAVLCGIVAGMQWCQEKPADVKAVVDKVEDVLPVVKTPSEQRRAKLLAWATVLHFLYAPAAAEVMLSVGSCTLIDDKLYNMYNLSLECFGGEHIATVVCVVLPTLLVLCLAIPWYEHNYIYHVTKSATYKERQFEHMSTQALGICHLSFEARYWYYFNVVFFRKVGLAICAASIHAGGIKFQAYAAMVVLNAALLVHFRQQPFYYDDVDQLESYSLIISQGYAAALALAGDFGDDGGKSVLAVCILIAQFGFIAKAIWVFRRNSDKNINNKGAMDLPRNLPEGLGGEDDLPPESEMGEMDIENLRAAGMLPCLGENAPLEAHKKMESFTNKWEIKINELVDSRNKRDIEEAEAARRKGPGAVIELDMKSDDFEEDEHSPLSPKDSVDDPTSSRADFIKQRRHRGHRSRSSRSTPKGATMLEMEEVPKPRAQVSRSEASRDSRQSSRSTTVADVSSSEATGFVWKQQSKPGTTRSSQRSGKSGLALQDGTIDYSVTNITEDVSGRPQMATRPTPNSPTGRTRSHSDRSQELESGAELSESVAASSRPRRPESPARMNVSLAEDSTGLDSKETAGQAPGVNIQQHKSSKPRSKGKRPSRKASNPGGERYVKKMQDSSSVQDSEIQHI